MKKILLFALIVFAGTACNKNTSKPTCATQVCTQQFVSIGINFTDNNGQAVTVTNYRAINQRTGLQTAGPAASSNLNPGYYVVANDSDLKNLSTDGDDIAVTGTNPTNNQTKTVTVKVAGGCACHVSKVSGQDEVTFN